MKRLMLFLSLFVYINICTGQVKNVLFVGNSYTYVNDLPQLLKDVAISFGDTIFKDQSTPGGYTFNAHSTNATTLSKIAQGTWDNVILQAQSQEPSFLPSQVAAQTYPYAKILVDAIKSANPCTEPIFFMTWGRKNGDASNCAAYPPICTYAGMQQRLRESYLEMADSNKATTSPVGVAWSTVRDSFPSIELYNVDESHPSIYGSYLAACVFYATLYQKSPIGSTSIPTGISAIDALNLQTIASKTVLDSLTLWRINANLPTANFSFNGGNPINFNSNSTNSTSYSWDFGDGNTSTLENPSHSFLNTGIYAVQLIVYDNNFCFSDTIVQNVNITTVGVNELINDKKITIYPNPANNFIEVASPLTFNSVIITDVTGKVVKTAIEKSKIDISQLTKGIYFLQVVGNKHTNTEKFIKQ